MATSWELDIHLAIAIHRKDADNIKGIAQLMGETRSSKELMLLHKKLSAIGLGNLG